MERCARQNLKTEVFDALVTDEKSKNAMDIVLADLPCSGLGIIGRKPDIKLRFREENLQALAALQREILSVVRQYVKRRMLI